MGEKNVCTFFKQGRAGGATHPFLGKYPEIKSVLSNIFKLRQSWVLEYTHGNNKSKIIVIAQMQFVTYIL